MSIVNLILRILFFILPVPVIDAIMNRSLPVTRAQFRRFCRIDPDLFEYFSRKKMLFMFRKAAANVPAYRQFLQKSNIDPEGIRNIQDLDLLVPPTTKDNYVRQFPMDQRCTGGTIPASGFLEESSGSTGTSTFWIRSEHEEVSGDLLTRATMKHLYGTACGRQLMLNCFATGGWSGGQRFGSRLSPLAIMKTIGPVPSKIVRCLKEMGPDFTYLLGGYPPFIVEFIEFCKSNNFPLKEYPVNIFTGGEGFPEQWRRYVMTNLKEGALIYSVYGAIDLDTGISVETPFTVAMRDLFEKDDAIKEAVLKTNRTPCFLGQVSNLKYYIRETPCGPGSKELEITVMNLSASAPLIKYLIGDEGGFLCFRELCDILSTKGWTPDRFRKVYSVTEIVPFPLIFLFGRKDGTVSINGALISPSEIQKIILSDTRLTSAINTFRISEACDSSGFNRLFIKIELREKSETESPPLKDLSSLLAEGLSGSNECFRNNIRRNPSLFSPVIQIFPFGSGVFSTDENEIKRKYI